MWQSRRRLRLKWSPQHERLCKCHLLVSVYSPAPDYENIAKITRLVSCPTWMFLADAAFDRYALMSKMEAFENEMIAEDHSEPKATQSEPSATLKWPNSMPKVTHT